MRRHRLALALASGLAVSSVAACAPKPDAIAPAVVPAGLFSGLTCAAARDQRTQVQSALATLEAAQHQAATGDAIGVFLFAVPISTLSGGNKASAIGDAKGRLIALDARLAGC